MTRKQTTLGVHHVGLTVPDLVASRRFFEEGLGFELVGEKPDYPAAFVSDGSVMLTLWQAEDPASAQPADRKRRCGLHHLALRVQDGATLDQLADRLAKRDDVRVEFLPELVGQGPARHMMFYVPGNIRLEIVSPEG